jgi:hypothetical protein
VTVRINGQDVHFLTAHPTPPTFDGAEDRNGKRNHDEIRFWADYVPAPATSMTTRAAPAVWPAARSSSSPATTTPTRWTATASRAVAGQYKSASCWTTRW